MDANRKHTSGWTQGAAFLPQTGHTQPTPLPDPMPMPTPPVITPPGELCDDMVLVMSYVKMQQWDQTYELETALDRGTIFPELDLPFVGEGACSND